MDLAELVVAIRNAQAPDRALDAEIAAIVGYEGSIGDTAWRSPEGNPTELPYFTRLIEDALIFARFADPDHIGGVTWSPGSGKATMNEEKPSQAANPAMALCIAALQILRAKKKECTRKKVATRPMSPGKNKI